MNITKNLTRIKHNPMFKMQVDEPELKVNNPISNCGILSRPDGSAIFSQGKTTVMAGVYGPVETKTQKVLIDKAHVEAHFRPKSGLPGVGDRLYETIIRNICETALIAALYPRSGILIIIQEMQNGGELISCSVNAACLALLDAGIDMKFLVASVTCSLDADGNMTLDPTNLQQDKAKAIFVFVFDSAECRVVASYTKGSFSLENYQNAIHICRKDSTKFFEYYKQVVSKKLS